MMYLHMYCMYVCMYVCVVYYQIKEKLSAKNRLCYSSSIHYIDNIEKIYLGHKITESV